MLPVALAAALAVTVSDGLDWSKASDDLRFASLKPVMTLDEALRLTVGKEMFAQGCGTAKTETGEIVSACVDDYSYRLTGRKDVVGFCFYLHSGPNPPKKGILVAFHADEVLYKRNKEGLFVAQPKK